MRSECVDNPLCNRKDHDDHDEGIIFRQNSVACGRRNMGSNTSKSKNNSGGTTGGKTNAPADNLPKKDVVLRKKLDSAVKTGVLNLADMVKT